MSAAGNEGFCGDRPTVNSPSTNKNGLSIAATHQPLNFFINADLVPEQFNNLGPTRFGENNIASFSGVGPTVPDNRQKPDLAAPGLAILSSTNVGNNEPTCKGFNQDKDIMMRWDSDGDGHGDGDGNGI